MEKRRSSRKTEESRPPSVHKGGSRESLSGADEPSSYEILFKKDSDYIVGPLPKPADLKAFNDVLHRWTKLRESDDAWEAKCVIDAAGRITRKQLMEIVGKDIGRLRADLAILDVVVKTLKAVDDRAAKVFILRVIEGKTDEDAASALEISKAAVKDSWRDAKRLIAESLENGTLSFRVSKENVPSNQERRLPSIIARATEVIGDRQEAMRWLGTPVRGLDYATPISLLATDEGTQRVNDILGQIEHGVW